LSGPPWRAFLVLGGLSAALVFTHQTASGAARKSHLKGDSRTMPDVVFLFTTCCQRAIQKTLSSP
ncbi:hypothetical protein KJ951_04770, partial [Patescibacteria group bacterium]|nr:hypothetical protein [Patescibacteria group bacterium]MBU1703690.1 hypothetical protein [Patescibacteria group bacterium]MBU1953661.1 hypothetical protein [Patescibacteria group bacterium]